MIIIIILVVLLCLIHIFEVSFIEGFDGYYIIWYRKHDTSDGIVRVKYSKRITKFKE